eukprot:COSAG02_NODE_331_length_24480_cov_22.114720_20_plen_189_part_00
MLDDIARLSVGDWTTGCCCLAAASAARQEAPPGQEAGGCGVVQRTGGEKRKAVEICSSEHNRRGAAYCSTDRLHVRQLSVAAPIAMRHCGAGRDVEFDPRQRGPRGTGFPPSRYPRKGCGNTQTGGAAPGGGARLCGVRESHQSVNDSGDRGISYHRQPALSMRLHKRGACKCPGASCRLSAWFRVAL